MVIAAAVVGSTSLVPEANAQLPIVLSHEEANQLHDAAMAMETVEDISRVARLHGEAANVRGMDDPRLVECVRFQGALLHLDGQPAKAQAEFERAAAIAMVRGENFQAGLSLVDAAFAAQSAGDDTEAYRLAQLALRLSRGEDLSRAERTAIQRRLPRGFNDY